MTVADTNSGQIRCKTGRSNRANYKLALIIKIMAKKQ
jgi:hypothetical protein